MFYIIIPAYNEEKNIGRAVRGLFDTLCGSSPYKGEDRGGGSVRETPPFIPPLIGEGGPYFFRVLVVDDGSEDATARVAEEAGAFVIRHMVNRGQGAALQTGDEYALRRGAESVVHIDADVQFYPADIAPALKIMQDERADAVFGSRFLDNRSKIPFLKKYFVFPVSRAINNLITGVKLTDAHNGFRVLSRKALEKIKITQDGMAHNTEIVSQIKKSGLKFTECPTEVTYAEYGQGIVGGLKILRDLILSFLSKI